MANVADKKYDEMTERMKKMESMIASLVNQLATTSTKPKVEEESKKDKDDKTKKWKYSRNMGEYCYSCGYHLIGVKHTCKMCTWQKEGHDGEATWTNRGNGSKEWPPSSKVTAGNKEHATYKKKQHHPTDRDWGLRVTRV